MKHDEKMHTGIKFKHNISITNCTNTLYDKITLM